jgi:hypothetical protein
MPYLVWVVKYQAISSMTATMSTGIGRPRWRVSV